MEAGTETLRVKGTRQLEVIGAFTKRSAEAKALTDPASRAIRRRDSLFRRSLGLADVAAVSLSLVAGAAWIGGHELATGALAVPIVFVLIAKAVGLYDRDEHLLHRTTLDELPRLLQMSTLFTLLLLLADGLVVQGAPARIEILAVWILLFALLVTLRSLARYIAR